MRDRAPARCRSCPRRIRRNIDGYCSDCRRRCIVCRERTAPADMVGIYCLACLRVMTWIEDAHQGDAAGPKHRDIEERVERYSARAKLGKPLFEE